MAAKLVGKLPVPPADLDNRKLPLKLLDGSLFRIHHTRLDCLFFGTNKSERFDDPLGEYGVFYAALQPDAAFAEVFLRQLSAMIVPESSIQERSMSEVLADHLHCVDLSSAGLRQVSCDNRIATEMPYVTVGKWSRAFFLHPQQPDGIIYRSRHNPQLKCVALFDRCQSKLRLKISEPLLAGVRRSWTVKQIARYALEIEPTP